MLHPIHVVVCLLAAYIAGTVTSLAQGFDYQFNADGVLPSQQLATFGGNVVEAVAFSVSGGYLHQNTLGAPDNAGYYEFHGVFDHSIDATLVFRARLIECSPPDPSPCAAGAAVGGSGGGHHYLFNLTPAGLWIPTPPNVGAYESLVSAGTAAYPSYSPFNEHTYTVTIPAGSPNYKVMIDGHTVATGVANQGMSSGSYAWFGDGTPSGGNAVVDWDFVTLRNRRPSYNICALYDETRAVRSGATYPIKVQLCDASGVNLSRADLILTGTSITKLSSQTNGALIDAGYANPDNNFRYDDELAGYIFNLKTDGLASGTYSLNMGVGTDSQSYSVKFQVK